MLNLTSRKRPLAAAEDLEDGEVRDIDPCDVGMPFGMPLESLDQYNDGYDDNLLGDAADRARLESLSELERECELYERSVKREEMFYKWGIKCFLLSKDKDGNAEDSGSNSVPFKERSSMRRLNLEAQRAADKRRSAIERLVAQRNNRRMRDDDPEFLCEELQDEEVVKQRLAEQQLEQLQVAELTCTDTAKKLKLKARDIYSDESSASTDDENYMDMSSSSSEPETFISSLEEVKKALLTRYHLERYLDIPIFDQTVIGCFVRISLCGIPSNHPAIYRLTRIVGIERTEQEYYLGNRRTRVKLLLKHGAHERSFRLDAISNQPVLEPEFLYWMKACQRDAEPLPSIKSINKKEKDIDKARNYRFTEGDIELMVQTKQRAGQKPVSAAYRKVCLIMERDMAVDANDLKKAHELQKQIKLIDEQSLSEHQREKRVQYMSPTITVPTRIPNPPEPSTKTKPKKFDWQQYMRRRYKKFAHLSSEQVQQLQKPIENATNAVSSDTTPPAQAPELEELNLAEEQNIEKIDLYELHNFEVNLDVSKLMQFSEIFHEIDGIALETVAQ